MTLWRYHLYEMPWAEILQKAASLGYTSHQAKTCGLHIHVNRDAFGATEAVQDACIARILYFFEKHWEELLKFSRRTQRQLERWAARYGYKEQPKETLEHAKKGGHGGRYTCVNLTNADTTALVSSYAFPWAYSSHKHHGKKGDPSDPYLEALKDVASSFGYTPEAIDRLAAMGFCADEIEEFMCCGCYEEMMP